MAITIIESLPSFSEHQHDSNRNDGNITIGHDTLPRLVYREEYVKVSSHPNLVLQKSLNEGTIYVTEGQLCIFNDSEGIGIAIDYPSIGLHAISRSPPNGLGASIYCQLENEGPIEGSNGHREDLEDLDEVETNMREIYFTPRDEGSLEGLFDAISKCAALHPDEEVEDDGLLEEEELLEEENVAPVDPEEGEFLTSQNPNELSEQGKATLARLESLLENEEQRFQDPNSDPAR